ncbi:lytic polysaccharide monooxygenase auxiliary activity family 9 protein [Streptomyces sp. NPDC001262]|uniref:lytic polysaccharide monooxygenase auxiliary activity family 9 protein n=1 Tax=unclassified Streptomyces TaxID=2593676 RepID=UPI0036996256
MSNYGGTPRHGLVIEPRSRAAIYLNDWRANDLEAGKFFPQSKGGLPDPYAPDDAPNRIPPEDGELASAGRPHSALLDEPHTDWFKTPVTSGGTQEFVWRFTETHRTRRWNYFITRAGWSPNAPLSRAQFEDKPFHQVQLACRPYWTCDGLRPESPTRHTVTLPERQGYQVILAVWEVADTGNAFYQVIDVDFVT